MDADEKDIYNYLKSWPHQFVSVHEICRRAGDKKRYREDAHWAVPILRRMTESNIVETNDVGNYRLRPDEEKQEQKKWISPQIKKILEESGKDFKNVIPADNDGQGDKV
jgi:hypothetical protein